jgi:hypothetical protein
MEESRQPGAPASTEDVELFFDHGILPGVSSRPRNPLWPIGTAQPELPAKLTALGRAVVAAGCAWRPLVRELRNGTLIATGERFDRGQEPWRDADRREIGSAWLNINGDLWFDVGANTVCRIMGVGFGSRPVPVWFEIRVRGADEATKFNDDQPVKRSEADDRAGRTGYDEPVIERWPWQQDPTLRAKDGTHPRRIQTECERLEHERKIKPSIKGFSVAKICDELEKAGVSQVEPSAVARAFGSSSVRRTSGQA